MSALVIVRRGGAAVGRRRIFLTSEALNMIISRAAAFGIIALLAANRANAQGPQFNVRPNQAGTISPRGLGPAANLANPHLGGDLQSGLNPYRAANAYAVANPRPGATPFPVENPRPGANPYSVASSYANLQPGATGASNPSPPSSALGVQGTAAVSGPFSGSEFAAQQASHAEPICTQCDDGSCDVCQAVSGDGPRLGFTAFSGTDAFRGPPEGPYTGNFGVVNGLNAAAPIVDKWGLGWQLGASYGVYDFAGRPTPATRQNGAQQQIFVTTGFFRRASEGQRLSFGLVHDWMVNNNYGQYALSPTLSQWRGQLEWSLSGRNSLGVWGAVHDRTYIGDRPDNHNQFRGISQINLFWHHKYQMGADGWLYVGVPASKRLAGSGLVGAAIIGGAVQVPLTERLGLYAARDVHGSQREPRRERLA